MQSPPTKPPGFGGTAPYAPLPASPTLTNPDMILPDYDENAMSLDRSESPLTMWQNAHSNSNQFDLSPSAFTAGPITPTTPIIYGNGTMLSDIGEVTEVESTCAPARSRSGSTRSEFAMVTSTALPYEAIKKRIKESRAAHGHGRRESIESTSTITTHEQPGLFADFDDAVSVDDSNFQGDDEGSVADSYIDENSMQESIGPARPATQDLDEDRYSTPLSRRAEQILANAKRRLTTMEGNLSRARSSLYSPTLSSLGSQSTPSPRPATSASVSLVQESRQFTHGHSRISSESNVPTGEKPDVSAQRSSSALGTAGGYRRPSRNGGYAQKTGRSDSAKNSPYGDASFSKSKTSLHVRDRQLEPLSEDEVFEGGGSPSAESESAQSESLFTPTFGSLADKALKRSSSAAQMRDIKDQVSDLKGRLSTLRDQARADSMKRRSLQSLRTPSPFTHAQVDQWYADANGHEGDQAVARTSGSHAFGESHINVQDPAKNLREQEPSLKEHEEESADTSSDREGAATPTMPVPMSASRSPPSAETGSKLNHEDTVENITDGLVEQDVMDMSEVRSEDGYQSIAGNEYDDAYSDSGESSYHDSVQAQISHEDREDAFDYEHFFLHSAMGSMSRRRMHRRGSGDSLSSEDSVETTRGPIVSQPLEPNTGKISRRSRRGSAGSTSTVDSFATATEGRNTRAGTSAGYDYPEQIIVLPERARTHTPDTARRATFSADTVDMSSAVLQQYPRRSQSSAATFKHRPGVASSSSFDSAGTHRSFPLVHRSKPNGDILTPEGSSPNQELQKISEVIMSYKAGPGPIQTLPRDDQILVERLVASLGRCVLGLSESGRAGTESRVYRRKIEAAYHVLEGST
ncbi:hypothetical protein F5Y16DRAFT_369401 [Xylariaceae sp. FL0255]|nr:hypothetical protein F5Y16DRAFT_369401 [Xylariaceae sp. FL0255]